jgi:DNA-binding MarR family transcriptional regulator/GNAT superfamily N-acetyltransferase
VLYELAHRDGLTASDLGRDLNVDPGYLSRLLAKFEARGLLTRSSLEADGRRSMLALTATGREMFAPLDKDARDQVAGLLEPLSATDRGKLVRAMETVQRLLGGSQEPIVPISCDFQPGDLGWIIHRQSILYHEEYGWDETFEALAAEIAGAFAKTFDPKCERCWIAERRGEVVGSVFLARASDEVAKLHLLYVEPSARRLGIGRRLVDECIRFARTKGYKMLTLWTNDVLVSARRIYEGAGFELVKEERHRSFGKELVGQTWELAL